MSNDILETLIKKIQEFPKFFIQIDETTDISRKAQLLSVVRFVDVDSITEEYLFCKEFPERTTGQETFCITKQFFTTHGMHWSNCISVCVDGASAMMGADKGFAAWVKRQNPAIQITHSCIYREALMIKLLTQELSETMSDCIEIVNLIKAKALNSRIFLILCDEMGSEHQSLLFYTSVRWLLRGKIFARLFELLSEIKQLLKQNKHELYKYLEDDHWIAKLVYMADVFEHMNELNIKMQGISESILICSDKLHGFQQKLLLWQNKLRLGSLEMFPRSYKNQKHVENGFVLNLAKKHLTLLPQKYNKYFFAINTEQYG